MTQDQQQQQQQKQQTAQQPAQDQWDFSKQQEKEYVPGIGMQNCRPITCRTCKGTWYHLKNGTTCAACNNSLVELISDEDFTAMYTPSHTSSNATALNSSRNSDERRYDKESGKRDQTSSSQTS